MTIIISDADVRRLLTYNDCRLLQNNSGLAIQFAAPGALLCRKMQAETGAKDIPKEWLGTDLSAVYSAGFRPSP